MSLLERSSVRFGLHISHRQKNCVLAMIVRVSIPQHYPQLRPSLATRQNIALKSCHHTMQFSWMIDNSDSGPDTIHEPGWLTYYCQGDFFTPESDKPNHLRTAMFTEILEGVRI